ncbi:unnamed protein product [Lathyrus sativus]|nr:unnamed protein product [Lathyrus sativus]
MKYMSRLLTKMQRNPNFNHHSKCEKMELTHLSFVDDILLFYRGNKGSLEIMTQTKSQFFHSTGLVVNPSKCNVYLGVVEEAEKQHILRMTGYNKGKLHFRYRGVPLTSRKFSVNHYLPLVEKILHRIHHWSEKLLSHVGRV